MSLKFVMHGIMSIVLALINEAHRELVVIKPVLLLKVKTEKEEIFLIFLGRQLNNLYDFRLKVKLNEEYLCDHD